jgi:hypothetical protein
MAVVAVEAMERLIALLDQVVREAVGLVLLQRLQRHLVLRTQVVAVAVVLL